MDTKLGTMTQALIPVLSVTLLDSSASGFSSEEEGAADGAADDKKSIKESKASKWSTKSKDENETWNNENRQITDIITFLPYSYTYTGSKTMF